MELFDDDILEDELDEEIEAEDDENTEDDYMEK